MGPRPLQVTFFFRLVNLNICGCNFFQGHMYVQQKNMCFEFWARVDTKFLNLSHHVLSMDGWPGDATFFLLGQPLEIIRVYSAKKGPAPWILFLTPAPRPLQVTFLVGETEHMWLQTFSRTNVCSTKNMCLHFGRALTQMLNLSHHVLSMDGWPGDATFFLWGQPLKTIRMYSATKGPAPWNLFLTPAPPPLQVTFFG